jgi:hypothetical protein
MATVERRNCRPEIRRTCRPRRSAPLGPRAGADPARGGWSVCAAFGTAGTAALGTARKPLQLDELQAQRFDPRNEAVKRGAVGHAADQQCLRRRRARLERVERAQQPGRQPAGDPEGVLSAHVVLPSGAASPPDMVGATG